MLPWCYDRTNLTRDYDRLCMLFESVELNNLFLFAFETKGRNFESTVIFFYNSNVKLKYIFDYLC